MADLTAVNQGSTALRPIKVSLLETLRMIRQSYRQPLEHAQDMQQRYGNAVMQRIGMTHDTDGDFEHPRVAPGHPLRRHVLFRTRRPLLGATR